MAKNKQRGPGDGENNVSIPPERELEQLRWERERYRFIIETSSTVVFDWDYVKGESSKIGDYERYAAAKESFENIIRHEVQRSVVHPDDWPLLKKFTDEAEGGKSYTQGAIRLKMADGSFRWSTLSVHNIHDREGNLIRTIGTLRDMFKDQAAVFDREMNLRRLDTIIEDTEIFFWEYDVDRKLGIMGKATRQALGVNEVMEDFPESLIAMGRIHKSCVEEYRQLHRDIEAGAPFAEMKQLITMGDGKQHWKWLRYHTVFSDEGRPVRAVGTAVDITDQVEAESRYRGIVAMQDAMAMQAYDYFIFNLTQNLVMSEKTGNTTETALVGLSYDDFVLRSAEQMISPAQKRGYFETFNREKLLRDFSSGKSAVSGDIFFNDGQREVWLNISLNMTNDPRNGDVMAFSFGVDITRQKQTESVLDAVCSFGFDLVALLNLKDGTLTMFKKQGKSLDYINLWEPVGFRQTVEKAAKAYVLSQDRKDVIKKYDVHAVRAALEGGDEPYEFTFRTQEPGGEVRIKKSRFTPFDISRNLALFTRIDVTDVVRAGEKNSLALEEALESARQANAAKTAFLSAMSHDIRTPLNAIVGMTELALASGRDPRQIDESLSVIKDASGQLLVLINDILEMSRIESGTMVAASGEFRQGDIIDKLLSISTPLVNAKGIALNVETDITHDRCTGDSLRLSRILENIMSNAIKFTPHGGSIMLQCSELAHDNSHSELSRFRYVISDTGIGMTNYQLEHVFEPYYRTGTAEYTGAEGTGLGLAIVKSSIELLGGSVEVKSKLGMGTQFIVELAFHVEASGQEQRESDATVLGRCVDGDLKVLLVEDHPINALVATRLLERCGAVVECAENGMQGFNMFRESAPGEYGLILMDVQMPVMNGYEATVAIRKCDHPQAKSIPIVAMTANAFAEDVKNAIASGMNDHLAKPVDGARLSLVLENLATYRRENGDRWSR